MRNYIGDMRDLIDQATSNGPYVAAVVAERIVEQLRDDDPELLDGFLDLQAVQIVRDMIIHRDASKRAYARVMGSRSVFAGHLEQYEQGDAHALDGWLRTPFTCEGGLRKKLADLTAADLEYVASTYEARAQENALMAAFLRALLKTAKSKRRTVGELFDETKLNAMWASIAHIDGQR